ncbi:N-terminal double-transmembrane domain-containing protein [Filimonas lacunae]|uniref:N-terminal double-transmembrane domain-containing protein n=1 Tax=Filimonas lacunae TaxID=477680 RepID=A0A173MPD5_9BACT|nr:BatA domain-containing protein [Filimonas lacunae]BAV09502.1 DUF1550 domain-containing protein [Filimonas lacunae]SIS74316.1 N-terminal double-transmembrane domain-containing protein [Filimonas lacunae]
MLQLLHPIWLLAGTAIIIPIVLHLWNTRQGKILPVGSLLFLQQQAPQPAINLKLTQLLLLLLRCLLLLLLALLLAQPVWQPKASATSRTPGWILVDKADGLNTYTYCQPAIDSLLRAGYQLHYLQPGFEKTDTSRLRNDTSTHNTPVSYWSLLPALQQQAPANIDLYLFTNNRLRHFYGNRAVTHRPIHWQTYTPTDNVNSFIDKAWLTADKKIYLQLAHTHSNGTTYTYREIAPDSTQHDSISLGQHNGQWQVALPPQPPVNVDTSVMLIGVLASEDAPYMQAALTAIRNYTHLNMQVVTLQNNAPAPVKLQWLIWLSAQQVPATYQADYVLQYDTGKTVATHSAILTGHITEPLFLQQRTQVATSPGLRTLWRDGFGEPLLYSASNAPQVYRFASRFNPAWNNLTWSSSFPQMLLQVLHPATVDIHLQRDNRSMDTIQLQPSLQTGTSTLAGSAQENTPLTPACWLLAVAVFALERFFTHAIKKGGQPHAA